LRKWRAEVKRFVTSDDLTLLSKKAFALAKLAASAQRLNADLSADKKDMKAVHEAIKRDQKRLRKHGLTKKQRGKIERKLQYHHEWLDNAEVELKERYPAFLEAMSQIESVLRELAASYEELANVYRFEAG
jgi:septal ring factor EnvC (AmiA/AmiB activator)